MDAGVEVKVEDYDGSYVCLFCGDSVRGLPALVCGECNSNPWHRTCDKDLKYTEVCPTCNRQSVKAWTGAGSRTATPSEIINLTGEGEGGAADGATCILGEQGVREDVLPAVGGGVVAADTGWRGAQGGQTVAGSGSGGKGKEPAWAEASPEGGSDGAATSAEAGAVGGWGGKGKGRADNGSARGGRARFGGEGSGGKGRGGQPGQSGGPCGSRAGKEQRGEGSNKRAAPEGGEGEGSGGGKRGRRGTPGPTAFLRRPEKCSGGMLTDAMQMHAEEVPVSDEAGPALCCAASAELSVCISNRRCRM